MTNDLNHYSGVSLTADTSALVTVQTDSPSAIWVAPERGADTIRQISTSTGTQDAAFGMDWTADGRLIFTSSIGDDVHIWSVGADGSPRKQLTYDGRQNLEPSPRGTGSPSCSCPTDPASSTPGEWTRTAATRGN